MVRHPGRKGDRRKKVTGDPLTPALAAPRAAQAREARPRPTRRRPGRRTPVRRRPGAGSLTAEQAGPDGLRDVWQAIRPAGRVQPTGAGGPRGGRPARRTGAACSISSRTAGPLLDDLWTAWVLRPNGPISSSTATRPGSATGTWPDRAATWQCRGCPRRAPRLAVRAGRRSAECGVPRPRRSGRRPGGRRGRRADAAPDDAGRLRGSARVHRRVRRGRRRAGGDRRLPRRRLRAAREARSPAGDRPVGGRSRRGDGARDDGVQGGDLEGPSARRRSPGRSGTRRRPSAATASGRGRDRWRRSSSAAGWRALDARPRRPAPPDPAPRRLTIQR